MRPGNNASMGRLSKLFGQIKHRLIVQRNTLALRYKKVLGRAYVRLSIFQAEMYLRKTGPITILIDNSALGHGVTHETAWINTGKSWWGGKVPLVPDSKVHET